MSTLNFLYKIILRITNEKKQIGKLFINPPRGSKPFKTSYFSPKKIIATANHIEGYQLLTLKPKNLEQPAKGHIFFLHGGAYALEATPQHRLLVKKLVVKYRFTCTYFDYPLAPEDDFEKTNRLTFKAYELVTRQFPGSEFYVFGDSAGGGLALSLIQQLRDGQIYPFPKKTVLQSPWVNLKMDNPAIPDFERKDLLLSLEPLKKAVYHYVKGKAELNNPIISPLFGSMDNLGSVFLLYGTHEILYPDCQILSEKLKRAKGTNTKVKTGRGMLHDWILFAMPESKETLKEIINFYME